MNHDMLTVPLGDRTYDIFFGEGICSLFQEWICRFYPGGQVFVVTDRNVASIYGEDIRLWLGGIPHQVHAVPAGEENKNWQTVLGIYSFLARGGADRDSVVVALGGGVVGDLAGFAAATYLRGVPCIQIPTTLLAQVDSSVGGKTGFNLPEGKNLVGAFHQPRAVFIDHGFLRTLDDREMRAGMAEVVKCALAGDASLWETLLSAGKRWKSMSGRQWRDVIRRSVAFKASIVARDERESSVRRILNLGHTVGHAMERAAGYGTLLHGEAVAMGLAWEAVLSRRMGVTPLDLEDGLCAVLDGIGLALDDKRIDLAAISSAVGADKKRVVSDVDIPMVAAPGVCELKRVPLGTIRRELPFVRAEIGRKGRGTAVDSVEEKDLKARIEGGDILGATSDLERRLGLNPRDLRAMLLLSEAYLFAGKFAAAWETVKEALRQYPAETSAQRLARAVEDKMRGAPRDGEGAPSAPLEGMMILDEGAFEIRTADFTQTVRESAGAAGPGAGAGSADLVSADSGIKSDEKPQEASILTITMADVCWEQGEKEIARRIIDEMLLRDRGDARALEWKRTHGEGAAEAALAAFLGTIEEEYGHGFQGPH